MTLSGAGQAAKIIIRVCPPQWLRSSFKAKTSNYCMDPLCVFLPQESEAGILAGRGAGRVNSEVVSCPHLLLDHLHHLGEKRKKKRNTDKGEEVFLTYFTPFFNLFSCSELVFLHLFCVFYPVSFSCDKNSIARFRSCRENNLTCCDAVIDWSMKTIVG